MQLPSNTDSVAGGGLAEITLTFDNSRVMYGFCSLKEPNATLPRYILINWVSRGNFCCSQPGSTLSQTPTQTSTCVIWLPLLAVGGRYSYFRRWRQAFIAENDPWGSLVLATVAPSSLCLLQLLSFRRPGVTDISCPRFCV